MNAAAYNKYFIKIGHVWFDGAISFIKSDLTLYHGMLSPEPIISNNEKKSMRGYIKINQQSTLITDLSLPEDILWERIKKNTKYEIKRSEKEQIRVDYFEDAEMPKFLLDSFEKTYNQMYSSKGIDKKMNRKLIKKYCENNMIIFSLAFYQNEPLVFHSYIIDEQHARFYYSCSPFRERTELAAVIGRMNRYLHWMDFKYLKMKGITSFDWGGINSKTDPDDIARFKFSFGGEPVDRYNYIIANSLIGKILFIVKYKILKKYI